MKMQNSNASENSYKILLLALFNNSDKLQDIMVFERLSFLLLHMLSFMGLF